MELNESPVFLLFHTQQSIVRKDLPVSLYESGKLPCNVYAFPNHEPARPCAMVAAAVCLTLHLLFKHDQYATMLCAMTQNMEERFQT